MSLSEKTWDSKTDVIDHNGSAGAQYSKVRKITELICEPLETEDYVVQAITEVSPPKWHLAHTTWFFETFILKPYKIGYHPINDAYRYLFNSYYETVGDYFPRHDRGTLSRPTVKEIMSYRRHVDNHMSELLSNIPDKRKADITQRLMVGLNHEQQHQELLLMDIKRNFFANPLRPAYRKNETGKSRHLEMRWAQFEGGLVEIGFEGEGFSFDNETPRHKEWLEPHRIANRLVTNGEYLEFMESGGYENPVYWLSDGWAEMRSQGWNSPLYWDYSDGEWGIFTLSGMQRLDPEEPVSHVSFYEAAAFAKWKGMRLPTEAEWETAFRDSVPSDQDNFMESGIFHPTSPHDRDGNLLQGMGDLWEWTMSPYVPYPGNRPLEGSLGEYNAKFMANQMVLRGGSCVTPRSHIRITYRNFFNPGERWPFTGIRLADDA